MPWGPEDVSRHNKAAAANPMKRKMWAKVSTSALAYAEKKGITNPEAYAIKVANSAVKK
jgi:hypothetical protein